MDDRIPDQTYPEKPKLKKQLKDEENNTNKNIKDPYCPTTNENEVIQKQ